MPAPLDFALALLFAAAWPLHARLVTWPKLVRDVTRGDRGARMRAYRDTLLEQWGLALLVALTGGVAGRTLGALGVRAPAAIPGVVAGGLTAALAWLTAKQVRVVRAATDARRARLRASVGELSVILPTTPRELRLFLALSVTAGICEEFLYRGFLGWLLAPWLTLPGALLASSVAFGAAHAYQGPAKAVRTGVVGAMLAAVYLATRSLIPAMVLHALIDVGSGLTMYAARERAAPGRAQA